MSNKYDELDVRAEQFELDELCADVATQFLAFRADGADDGEATLIDYSVRTVMSRSETVTDENIDVDLLSSEVLRRTEQADQARATEFVEDFVVSMLDHPAAL